MQLEDILGRLKGVKGNGDQYMAQCPAHQDKRSSLAVARAENGGVVLKCLAGCTTEDIVDKLGIAMADLFPEDSKKGTAAKGKPAPKKKVPAPVLKVGGTYTYKDKEGTTRNEEITREYVYVTAQGVPVLKVYRTKEKSFPVIHLDKGAWYWGDGGACKLLYRLPEVLKAIKDGSPVYLVEGEKDADTLAGMDYCATTNRGGAGKWQAELSRQLAGAHVVILPDNDDPGKKHAKLVSEALKGSAADVRIVDLTRGYAELPEKGDVSDFMAALPGDSGKALLDKLVNDAPYTWRKVDDTAYAQYFSGVSGYCVENGSICAVGRRYNTPLCNFVALPTEEITRDDGVIQDKEVAVVGWDSRGRRMPQLRVAIAKFGAMSWALEGWGMAANIEPGQANAGKLRQAIQGAGDLHAVKRTVYTHTGWRVSGGKHVFLHAGGAIGAEDISVEMEPSLGYYDLSGIVGGIGLDMTAHDRSIYAIMSTLTAMQFVNPKIGVPLTGFMFLAPLRHFLGMAGCPPGFIPFLWGRTGSAKTTAATLILCHFGRDFSWQCRPASFQDTANNVRRKAFLLKDMPLLVDDYHPNTNLQDKRRMEGVAQLLSRTWGDGADRGRMKADTTLQEQMPPRGVGFETGEDLPNIGESGLARLYVINVQKGDVPINERMTELQQRARDGVFAQTMREYIEWLAPHADELPRKLGAKYDELRKEAAQRMGDGHKRLPSAVAHIMLGLDTMLEFMVAKEAIDEEEREETLKSCWDTVLDNGKKQSAEMAEEKPTKMFIDALRELTNTKRYRLFDLDEPGASQPPNMIGCRDKEFYYLTPGTAFGAVQQFFVEQGTIFPIGKNTLFRLMREEGMILGDASGNNVRQLRRGSGLVKGWFLWMPRHVLDGGEPPVKQIAMPQVVPQAEDLESNPFLKGGAE